MFPFTQEELRRRLHLDYETGLFTRLITTGSRSKAGTIATPLDKGDGYVRIGLDWKQYNYAHVVWFYVHGIWPIEVDHKNTVRSDNRPDNLREATRSQNMQALRGCRLRKTGYRGVTETRSGRYQAQIGVGKCRKQHVGTYDTAEQAYEAWCAAAIRMRGEFACLD